MGGSGVEGRCVALLYLEERELNKEVRVGGKRRGREEKKIRQIKVVEERRARPRLPGTPRPSHMAARSDE